MDLSLSTFETFYQSPLGHYVRDSLRDIFDVEANRKTLWLGYASDYMPHDELNYWGEGFSKTDKVSDETNRHVFSYYEKTLPFYYHDFERANVIHALELSDSPDSLLKEIYRILKPEGDLTLVVPNRAGLWSQGDRNPFGQGQPYSTKQIYALLERNQFSVVEVKSLLFLPPTASKLFIKSFKWIDGIAPYLCPHLGGVYVVKAKKHVYNATRIKADAERFSIQPVPA